MLSRLGLAIAFLLTLALLPAGARDEPKVKTEKPKAAKAKPPYDEKADAAADLETALKKAKKDNQRVLIQWGGNWCSWCVLLNERFKTDQKLAREMLYEYRVVHVDIGKFDKNMEMAKRLEANVKGGVPYLTVLDADGKVLANQSTDPFETKNADGKDGKSGHDPKKLLEFLKKHQAKPLVAEELMKSKVEVAAADDRRVMLHFGAPWCGWCHRLEDWMAKPEVAAILAKEFVDLKIDIDRMEGGKEILSRFGAEKKGIPWMAILDGQGKSLATSDDAKGANIGFPSDPAEIEHFTKMLQTTCRKLSKEEIEKLAESLRAESKPRT